MVVIVWCRIYRDECDVFSRFILLLSVSLSSSSLLLSLFLLLLLLLSSLLLLLSLLLSSSSSKVVFAWDLMWINIVRGSDSSATKLTMTRPIYRPISDKSKLVGAGNYRITWNGFLCMWAQASVHANVNTPSLFMCEHSAGPAMRGPQCGPTHGCVNAPCRINASVNYTIIGSDVLPTGTKILSKPMLAYCQLGPWTSVGFFIENLIFSFKKMQLKISSAKWRTLCLGFSVLTDSPPSLMTTAAITRCASRLMPLLSSALRSLKRSKQVLGWQFCKRASAERLEMKP